MHPIIPRLLTVVAYVLLASVVWLTIASGTFLWLAGLWDSPLISAWSRPWQWLAYARRVAIDDFSAILYLIAAAMVATAPFALVARFMVGAWWQARSNPGARLYGDTGFADRGEQVRGGFRLFK